MPCRGAYGTPAQGNGGHRLDAAGWRLSELHIDRACLSSDLVCDRGPDLAVCCKAWRVRNAGGRFAKDQFTIDFGAGQLTCPAGVNSGFQPSRAQIAVLWKGRI